MPVNSGCGFAGLHHGWTMRAIDISAGNSSVSLPAWTWKGRNTKCPLFRWNPICRYQLTLCRAATYARSI